MNGLNIKKKLYCMITIRSYILHLDGALVFGRAVIDELDVKYFNLDHKDKLEKCYDIALFRANDAFYNL